MKSLPTLLPGIGEMDRDEQTKVAIIDRLSELDLQPNQPVSLFEIGTALVPAGYSQEELVWALFALQSDKKIELLNGNRLQLLK